MMRKKPRPPYLFTATLSFCVHLAPARINDHLSALRGGRTPVFSILYVLYTHARRVRIKVSLSTRRFLYFFFSGILLPRTLYFILSPGEF